MVFVSFVGLCSGFKLLTTKTTIEIQKTMNS